MLKLKRPTPRKRVLVVDDDPAIAQLLAKTLGHHYEVQIADDGPGALALASKQPVPDLVLLDVMMPGIDGFGVASRMKLIPASARVPIIFVTAKDTPSDMIRGIQAGARHYISKPFKLVEVVKLVKKVLG